VNFNDLIGKEVIVSSDKLESESGYATLKVVGVECGGIWVEGASLPGELGNEIKDIEKETAAKGPLFCFLPFHAISFALARRQEN